MIRTFRRSPTTGSPMRICTTAKSSCVAVAQSWRTHVSFCRCVCRLRSSSVGKPVALAGKHAWQRLLRSLRQKLKGLPANNVWTPPSTLERSGSARFQSCAFVLFPANAIASKNQAVRLHFQGFGLFPVTFVDSAGQEPARQKSFCRTGPRCPSAVEPILEDDVDRAAR